MNLDIVRGTEMELRIPRVSGGEPLMSDQVSPAIEYSPRERG